ncbi:DUF4138 domain-containing protein [Flagellimonas sp.]|uniref:DUF4138 domain-containing protein n=1 Tax=Flagellimonas sp. TaxID=2058762 RepID=UPI003BAB83FA
MNSLRNIAMLYFLIFSQIALGQIYLDTIYANNHQNVALFFPMPIQRAVTGNSDFVFSYNTDVKERLGLVQAVPGKTGNLLAITSDGKVYSYLLKYAERLPRYHYFVQSSESIGTVESVDPNSMAPTRPKDSLERNNDEYKDFSRYLHNRKAERKTSVRKKGIRFRLEQLTYHGDQVYLVFDLHNKSDIDFEWGTMNLFVANGSGSKRATHQEIPLQVTYIWNRPKSVRAGQQKRFVYVVPKFVLGDKEELSVKLLEEHGNRVLTLKHR